MAIQTIQATSLLESASLPRSALDECKKNLSLWFRWKPTVTTRLKHSQVGFYSNKIKILVKRETFQTSACPFGWGCRIHWLHICRRVRSRNECSGYDTKQSNGEVRVMLGPGGIRSTPSLPLLPGPLWPGVVAPNMALSMG